MKKIVCFHLYNDFSGSPRVLANVLEGLLNKGYKIDLITSPHGVLTRLAKFENLSISKYNYRFSKFSFITFCRYCIIQLYTFLIAFRYWPDNSVVFYINTILPCGPALAAFIMRKKIVYHYHENGYSKGIQYKVLTWVMQMIASEIICVSDYQRSFLKRQKDVCILLNTVPSDFAKAFVDSPPKQLAQSKCILMLSSLKVYKGVIEFIELSKILSDYCFLLVINDTLQNIEDFLQKNKIEAGSNITICEKQEEIIPFYQRADLLISLTNSKLFIETFGLTALEAMTAGLPVIVPTVGGISELVDEGRNGYKIDVADLDEIALRISYIFNHPELYETLSNNALSTASRYRIERMIDEVEEILF